MQAKAYARIGDRACCHRQMRIAEATAAQVVIDNEPAETSYAHPGNTKIKQAEALLRLGDTTAASSYALDAISDRAAINMRARVHGMATLSMALTTSAEIERSVTHAQSALDEAAGMESRRIRERLVTMVDALTAFRETRVARDFIDRADAALTPVVDGILGPCNGA